MNVYDFLIESGIVVLLVYTPLFWGGVTPGALTVIEFVTAFLLVVWIVKQWGQASSLPKNLLLPIPSGKRLSLYAAAGFFLLLPIGQIVPLPAAVVKLLSPATYRVYVESATTLQQPMPAWLPLSVYAHATKQELLHVLVYPVIFFLTLLTFRTRRQVNRLIGILLAIGCVQAVSGGLGLLSNSPGMPSHFWLSGSFVNKNHFAGYLEMIILLGLGMFLTHLETRSSKHVMRPLELVRERYPQALLWLLGLVTLVCVHVLSGSRGGWLSLAVGVGCFGVLVFIRRLLRRWVAIFLIILPLSAGLTVMLRPALIMPRLETLAQLNAQSQVRQELWKTGLAIFQDFPVTGTGLGTFAHINQRYRTFRSAFHFNYAHNDYIQLLAETGLFGAAAAIFWFAVFLVHAFSAWRRQHSRWTVAIGAGVLGALVTLSVHGTTDFNFHIPANALLFTVLAALGTGMWNLQETRSRRHKRRSPPVSPPVLLPTTPSRHSLLRRQGLRIAGICCVGWYLFQILTSYAAFRNYERFLQQRQESPSEAGLLFEEPDPAIPFVQRAIRTEPGNARYAYALGSYLHQHVPEVAHPYAEDVRQQRLQAAEQWLHSAILHAPTNAWYYYELGRLSLHLEPCPSSTVRQAQPVFSFKSPGDPISSCAAARYFEAALRNAPHDEFLQETVGRWLHGYAPEKTRQMIRQILANEVTLSPPITSHSQQRSRFLYDLHLDFESDREKSSLVPLPLSNDSSALLAQLPRILNDSAGAAGVELGHDDGTAEWRTRLSADTQRVKKVMYLPKDLETYTEAVLKIFMNNGGRNDFEVAISVDEHLISTAAQTIPRLPDWYTIPFDPALLQGKTLIRVYIRVRGASPAGNYLQIWGDHDTPTVHSTFNFDSTTDLSADDGIQTGEYLIRLVLWSKPLQ